QQYHDGIYSEGGGDQSLKQSMVIDGVPFDFQKQALIFDRQAKKFTTCAKSLKDAKIIDVESVDGRLQLLLAEEHDPESRREDTIRAVDLSGNVLYEHMVVTKDTYILFAGWDPATRQIWFRVREVPYKLINDDIPVEKPNADYQLMVWDAASNTERRARLTVKQIKDAVDAVSGK